MISELCAKNQFRPATNAESPLAQNDQPTTSTRRFAEGHDVAVKTTVMKVLKIVKSKICAQNFKFMPWSGPCN